MFFDMKSKIERLNNAKKYLNYTDNDVKHVMNWINELKDEFPKESKEMYNYLNRVRELINSGMSGVDMLIAEFSSEFPKIIRSVLPRISVIKKEINEAIELLRKVSEIANKVGIVLERKEPISNTGYLIKTVIDSTITWLESVISELKLILIELEAGIY